MRKLVTHAVLAVAICGGLAACATGTDTAGPSRAALSPGVSSAAAPPTAAGSGAAGGSGAAAPSPPSPPIAAAPSTGTGPGAGNAVLAITVRPSDSDPAVHYTLTCTNGVSAPGNQLPTADAACVLIKNDPTLLDSGARKSNQSCTQQYGGPQQATVTGILDQKSVSASFSRTDGCAIAAWNAAKDLFGAAGGPA
ncbi:serine protease inhibitor [Arthrobacter sp. H14-L1]|uniref:serine protease inhibitor n=1 Tax=Arthrobacter sp. H14-L1 TaxID=2996697 RepID=UPI002270EBEA|nr:serine protease inhibitor [Arthrobacter sp. H14-L1]MCY0904383.1 serine protease inhibitor [Arthrobacter sp. H14-L1]